MAESCDSSHGPRVYNYEHEYMPERPDSRAGYGSSGSASFEIDANDPASILAYMSSGFFEMDYFMAATNWTLDKAYKVIIDILWPFLLRSMEPDWVQVFYDSIIMNQDLKWKLCRGFFDTYILFNRGSVSPHVDSLFNWTQCPYESVRHVVLGMEPLRSPDYEWCSMSNGAAYSVLKQHPGNEVTEPTFRRLVKALGMAFGNYAQRDHYSKTHPADIQVLNCNLLNGFTQTSGVLFLNLLGSWSEFAVGPISQTTPINDATALLRESWAQLHYIILETLIRDKKPIIIALYDVLQESEDRDFGGLGSWRYKVFSDIIFLLNEYKKVGRYKSTGLPSDKKQVHLWASYHDFKEAAKLLSQFQCLRPWLQLATRRPRY